MTVKMASVAASGLWARLTRLRDKWLVLAFLFSAFLWMEGTAKTFWALPDRLTRVEQMLERVDDRLGRLETDSEDCTGHNCHCQGCLWSSDQGQAVQTLPSGL
ncbi:MAG: hypothetical protein AAGI70_05190 [Pseudomonadota bacterium]